MSHADPASQGRPTPPFRPARPEVIVTIGDLIDDIVVRLRSPIAYESDTPATIEHRRGGSAANMAVAVAALGHDARFIGHVGDDATGDRLIATLRAEGVETVVRRGGRSATVVVLLDEDGERTMLTDRGSCADLADPDPAWLDGVDALHIPLYSLIGGKLAETAATMIEWAHDRRVMVSIDASSSSVIQGNRVKATRALLRRLRPDAVLCNADEFETLFASGPDSALEVALDAIDAMSADRTWPGAAAGGKPAVPKPAVPEPAASAPDGEYTIVVKGGAAPTMVIGVDGTRVHVPVPPLDGVRDTTGAGDAFAAGFVSARVERATYVDAVRAGHASARAAIAAASAPVTPRP